MGNLNKSLEHLMLAMIIGVVSIGVSFIGEMSKNVQAMAISVQELNMRMSHVSGKIEDHEMRIRNVETRRR